MRIRCKWFHAHQAPLVVCQLQRRRMSTQLPKVPLLEPRAEKLQVSVFFPNEQSVARCLHDGNQHTKKYDALSMSGNVRPRWRLLQQHVEA